jgi:hypothetical protein
VPALQQELLEGARRELEGRRAAVHDYTGRTARR